MKRLVLATIIISLLAGCSALPSSLSFLSPTQTNSPAPSATPFGLPATFTPDLFQINTQAPTTTPPTGTPNVTNTPFPTNTPTVRSTITLEPLDVSLFTPSAQLFVSAQRSTTQLVWGYNCDGARSIKFITSIVKPKRLKYVLLFVRLQDKYSARRTEWGAGAIMNDNDKGTYFYTLYLDQIADHQSFEDAWLQYQFVGSTVGLTVLGRSVVSRNEVSLTSCRVINR
jgi:hypothetical protein